MGANSINVNGEARAKAKQADARGADESCAGDEKFSSNGMIDTVATNIGMKACVILRTVTRLPTCGNTTKTLTRFHTLGTKITTSKTRGKTQMRGHIFSCKIVAKFWHDFGVPSSEPLVGPGGSLRRACPYTV